MSGPDDRHRDHPSSAAPAPVVVDNTARSRFEVLVDGDVVGFADYVERGDVVELPHTVVDRSMRGHGIAAILVAHALDTIVASGRSVLPTCWYVAQFIDEHPDYAHLRRSGPSG